jgi:signal transduction histidine kinase/CheY-like chemotaxis protein
VTSSSEGPVIETFVPFPAGSEGLRVLVVALPVELFAQFASGALKDAAGTPTGSAYVTDQAGTLVTAVGPSAELGDRAARVSEAIRDGRAGGRLAEQRLVVRPVSGTGLVVALTAPEGELTVDLPSTVPPRIALGGLALALLAVFLLTARSLREARRLDAARHAAEQAGHAADRANLAKSEFLSRMSHELRTPLNAILGFGQLLEMEEHVSPEQRESTEQIIKGGRRLLELINEVLDISRIESGMLRLSLEPVAIEEVVQDAGELIRPLADGRGIRLRTELPPDILDGYVTADRQRLGQVLLNLLSNALKYNVDQGTVSVIAAKGRDRVRIGVTDTGPGIPQDKISLLFTPFERLGAEQTNVEGTGLGLTLSKNLVEAMGGTLEVDTMAGAGTTFWVELQSTAPPSPQTHAPPAQVVHRPVETRGKVLYIEDNLSNLRLIERLMRHRADLELIPAMTGALGIELAQQHTPDVVFLDLHLSDLPGDEVLGRLRNDPRTGTIPVVILSADATPGQIE